MCCVQVKEAAESLQPGIIAQACGSYRRGKKDCGDVDILLTHPDGHSEKGLFSKLIKQLKEMGRSAVRELEIVCL
jgi:DNA polymerase lambda